MLSASLRSYGHSLLQKSRVVTRFFHRRMTLVCGLWLAATFTLALLRLAFPASPVHNLVDAAPTLLGYSLVMAAPIVGFLVATHAFKGQAATLQPSFRFALVGRWRRLSATEARARTMFGPVGFMASLLVGMLLNVGIRTVEFFTAVPAMSYHAPAWAQAMFAWMAFDVVVTGFFYMVAFAMALRTIPLFPRMLLFAWLIDVSMQLLIARQLAAVGGMPGMVVEPLLTLLEGNITKVAISAVIWLPYLLLSERVNVTYRHRTDARLA
jgi:hypothetical protein